jgi:Ala-tRNA(Pro) deacylase
MNVKEYLHENDVAFDVIEHLPVYDAGRLAQAVHVSGREVAKTVLLKSKIGDKFLVAVLPANRTIDFDQLRADMGGAEYKLATEAEIAEHCPDCELGVLPPFGDAYGIGVVVDPSLIEDEQIVFEGNTHQEAIRMSYTDFAALARPLVTEFAVEH